MAQHLVEWAQLLECTFPATRQRGLGLVLYEVQSELSFEFVLEILPLDLDVCPVLVVVLHTLVDDSVHFLLRDVEYERGKGRLKVLLLPCQVVQVRLDGLVDLLLHGSELLGEPGVVLRRLRLLLFVCCLAFPRILLLARGVWVLLLDEERVVLAHLLRAGEQAGLHIGQVLPALG